ncbi:MAG: response regulator [Proteobacteria bacterium]|nr:response regulator [Pseudomonadota bacterium]
MKEKIRVLIIEDNEAINQFIKEDLAENGYHVDSVYNGEDAIQKIENETYEIAILDIRLKSDISGIDILKKIKSKKASRKTYVIMHTVFGAPEDMERARRLGADAYVAKLSGGEEDNLLLREADNIRKKIHGLS